MSKFELSGAVSDAKREQSALARNEEYARLAHAKLMKTVRSQLQKWASIQDDDDLIEALEKARVFHPIVEAVDPSHIHSHGHGAHGERKEKE